MARRFIPDDPSIGERVRVRRELRGWSIRYAASRAGIAHSTLLRVERGELRTDRYMIADLAAALECAVTDLTGRPYVPADRVLESAHARVVGVWRALLEIAPDEPASGSPLPVDVLSRRAELVSSRRLESDYAGVVQMLPDLLVDLHSASFGSDTRTALTLMVDATHNAMLTLRHLGYTVEPAMAAERCRQAAERLDEAVPLAVADWVRAHAAFAAGSFGRASTLTSRNIDALHDHLGEPTAPEVLGMLHLTAAVSALPERLDEARDHMAEARHLADGTGETRSWTFGFGPANVSVWQMTLEVDAGEAGRAAEISHGVDTSALSRARQASYFIEMSRVLGDLERHADAIRMLAMAERTAPQLTRSSLAARESARYLLNRSRREAGGAQLRGLCERMGIAV